VVAWNPWTDLRERDDVAALNISFPFGPIPGEIITVSVKRKNQLGLSAKCVCQATITFLDVSYHSVGRTFTEVTVLFFWVVMPCGLAGRY
jgi:hypothetical protein